MIEVTETVVKSYDLDGLFERVKSLESSLDAIKCYDFMLFICLGFLVLSVVLFAVAHFKMDYIEKLLKEYGKN